MTITSTNHNPKNDSKYARRRSVWKGRTNQLEQTVAALRNSRGVRVYEYCDTTREALAAFEEAWNVTIKVSRRAPGRNEVMGQWVYTSISGKLQNAVPGSVRGDLRLLWDDFLFVTANRIGKWWGGTMNEWNSSHGREYSGNSLILFAPGAAGFDLIVSKYGYGEQGDSHHFYQWQARSTDTTNTIHVDNYDTEEELM